ncbi:MAG TPA: hypothetical protein VNE82_14670 [Candidatus Binataceae bacterium]|nr:hypothetical protein [Candidatus Binataceae bacterium]
MNSKALTIKFRFKWPGMLDCFSQQLHAPIVEAEPDLLPVLVSVWDRSLERHHSLQHPGVTPPTQQLDLIGWYTVMMNVCKGLCVID